MNTQVLEDLTMESNTGYNGSFSKLVDKIALNRIKNKLSLDQQNGCLSLDNQNVYKNLMKSDKNNKLLSKQDIINSLTSQLYNEVESLAINILNDLKKDANNSESLSTDYIVITAENCDNIINLIKSTKSNDIILSNMYGFDHSRNSVEDVLENLYIETKEFLENEILNFIKQRQNVEYVKDLSHHVYKNRILRIDEIHTRISNLLESVETPLELSTSETMLLGNIMLKHLNNISISQMEQDFLDDYEIDLNSLKYRINNTAIKGDSIGQSTSKDFGVS